MVVELIQALFEFYFIRANEVISWQGMIHALIGGTPDLGAPFDDQCELLLLCLPSF